MQFTAYLLLICTLIRRDASAQNEKPKTAPFSFKAFFSDSFDSWVYSQAYIRQMRCVDACKKYDLLQATVPTLPPYYYSVLSTLKTTVNCSLEIRGLKPYCTSLLKSLDLIQIGGFQYLFPLPLQLNFYEAQKYCRSRNLELAAVRNNSVVLGNYFRYFANLSMDNNLTFSRNVTFWELPKVELNPKIDPGPKIDKNNFRNCPTFTMGINDLRAMNATRSNETCKSNAFMFICEVPTMCYKDVCRFGFISRFRVTPAPAVIAASTPKGSVAAAPAVSEHYHLNHPVLFTKGCATINCSYCPPSSGTPQKSNNNKECNGKLFTISSSDKLTYQSALTACCALGMRPVSILNDDDAECVKDLLFYKYTNAPPADGLTIWTSGTDAGKDCNGRYTWCNGGISWAVNALSRLFYDQYNQTVEGDCLGLRMKANSNAEPVLSLVTLPCSNTMPVVCEASAPKTMDKTSVLSRKGQFCAGKTQKCVKSDRKDDQEKGAYDAENQKYTTKDGIKYVCDKFYQIVSSSVSLKLSANLCAERRQEIATIESFEELNCMRDLVLAYESNPESSDVIWLRGNDQECNSGNDGPVWCGSGNTISQNIIKQGQAGSRCVSLNMKMSKFGLGALDCNAQAPRVLCKDPCQFPTCPAAITCEMKKIPTSLVKKCQSTYMLVQEQKTMREAMDYCCQFGMGLLSIESQAEMNCLAEQFVNKGPLWTSATDLGCRGTFAWCTTGEMFGISRPFYQFKVFNQDSFPDQNCVSFLVTKDLPFKHEMCDTALAFICESPPIPGIIGPVSPSHRFNTSTIFL